MRIIQTPVRFYPAIGGVEKYVLDLSAQLVAKGHDVTVICANEPEVQLDSVLGIRTKRLRYAGKVANTNITPSLFFHLLREPFDLIHTHMPTPWSAEFSILAAKLKGKPCVLTYHNDVEKDGLLGALTKIYNTVFLWLVLAGVNKILVTQPRYLTDSRVLSRWRRKTAVVPNGISSAPAQPFTERDAASVLFVAVLDRYHRYKGLEYLIKAMVHLRERWPEIKLKVVGNGDLTQESYSLTRTLGVDGIVQFLGYVDDEALRELYHTATVFVLPSIDTHEGFGIVLLEAMGQGMPVVTTTTVGLSDDILEYTAGLVVPPKDPLALAGAIDQILGSRELAAQMGLGGNTLVRKKYLWSDICRTVETIYTEVKCNRSGTT